MKLLPDENLPFRLKNDFHEHEILTVYEMGWNGKINGQLLKLMLDNHFEVLITFDKNLYYQQNLSKYPITIMVLSAIDNSYPTLSELVPKIKMTLKQKLKKGKIEIK